MTGIEVVEMSWRPAVMVEWSILQVADCPINHRQLLYLKTITLPIKRLIYAFILHANATALFLLLIRWLLADWLTPS